MLAFVATGCSRTVRVPEGEIGPSSKRSGLHRIHTADDSYTTWQFSVTDSTLIIEKLSGSDDHYGKLALPFTVRLQDVQAVDRLERDGWKTGGVVVLILGVGAGILYLWALSNIRIPS
jgi:hypothetical protein